MNLRLAALALATAIALPAQATVATSSAVSDSVAVSSNAISHALKRSSQSSSGGPVAQGDYRVIQVAEVGPEVQEVTMQAVPGTGAVGELVLHMPLRAVERGRVAVGEVVSARERPYGVELARADTREAFFLLLDDPWFRELSATPVRL